MLNFNEVFILSKGLNMNILLDTSSYSKILNQNNPFNGCRLEDTKKNGKEEYVGKNVFRKSLFFSSTSFSII